MKLDRTEIDEAQPTNLEPVKLAPGLRIEQYELIRQLGRGGMGQVFLARDNRLGRRVAMKFLLANGRKLTDRFLVEARATAQCSHEHIVVIHDVDEYLGLPYMVLEYVEGHTLAQLSRGRRLPVGRTIELIVPVVKALVRAHDANIVHRDLKPANIVVTAAGTVKVLDFGVAKLFSARDDGKTVGTLPYMSPEQLGTDSVDHRSDLWAIGIILFELLAGKHPLDPISQGTLFAAAAAVDEPMPSLAEAAPGVPDRLAKVVARCLAKKKQDRYGSAAELLADLQQFAPAPTARALTGGDAPYPGLHSFQEADAGRFFGREADIAAMVARLRDQPLAGVVGPSGVGKSSFVRAGVVPALKASGEAWEALVVRPGRAPLAALAGVLEEIRDHRDSEPAIGENAAERLRAEPGLLGARLRSRARRRRCQILLFVDQHEELYTLVADAAERKAFTACLAGAADDVSGPLRVIVAMRSDFLDRAAEDRFFVEELTRGLVFLQPPSRAGLEAALLRPLQMQAFGFEPGIVEDMLAALETTPGALPLLQFTAAKMWEVREPARRVLTRESYTAMGGVAGALATHADQVLAGFAGPDQRVVRALFQRLVTPERTRAIVEISELRDVAPDVQRIVDHLAAARLLVVHTRGDGEGEAAVELVHESLIKSWPKLARWLDENQEDAAFLAQLRQAAKQWDQKGRVNGLVWQHEAYDEARVWRAKYPQRELPEREQAFLDAVFALATRQARVRRSIYAGVLATLVAVIGGIGYSYVRVSSAKAEAVEAADNAVKAQKMAEEKSEQATKAQADEQAMRKLAEERLAAFEQQRAKTAAATSQAQAATQKADVEAQKRAAAEQKAHDEQRARALAEQQQARLKAEQDKKHAQKGNQITHDLK